MSEIEATTTHETPAPITNGVVEGQPLSRLRRQTRASAPNGVATTDHAERLATRELIQQVADGESMLRERRAEIQAELEEIDAKLQPTAQATTAPVATRGRATALRGHLQTPEHDEDGVVTQSPTRAGKPGVPRARKASARLPRRSIEQIDEVVAQVVALVKTSPKGLRAEEIRETLKLQAKELPRVLKQGLATKALKKTGQKRATVYQARAGK